MFSENQFPPLFIKQIFNYCNNIPEEKLTLLANGDVDTYSCPIKL
jgi:hypothetical protein